MSIFDRARGLIPQCVAVLASTLCGAVAVPDIAHGADNDVASDDASADSLNMDEVIVGARRRTERAQDVPIPIAAISGTDLAAAGQYRLEDLNQRLPSTNIQFNNPRQTSIVVRGLGNNPANDALESSVGVYLDGVYLGRASACRASSRNCRRKAHTATGTTTN